MAVIVHLGVLHGRNAVRWHKRRQDVVSSPYVKQLFAALAEKMPVRIHVGIVIDFFLVDREYSQHGTPCEQLNGAIYGRDRQSGVTGFEFQKNLLGGRVVVPVLKQFQYSDSGRGYFCASTLQIFDTIIYCEHCYFPRNSYL